MKKWICIICSILVLGLTTVFNIIDFAYVGIQKEPVKRTYITRSELKEIDENLAKEAQLYVDYVDKQLEKVAQDDHHVEEYNIIDDQLNIKIITYLDNGIDVTLTKTSNQKTMTYYYENFGSYPEKGKEEVIETLGKLIGENRQDFKNTYQTFLKESDGHTLLKKVPLTNGDATFSYVENPTANILTIEIIQEIDL